MGQWAIMIRSQGKLYILVFKRRCLIYNESSERR